MYSRRVMRVDLKGQAETVVEVAGRPSGLGWLPDGRLLIVSMMDRRLLRFDDGALTEVANLNALASHDANDMVVDAQGRTYVGHYGFDLVKGEPIAPAEIILVTSGGDAQIAGHDVVFPNGLVITPDGRTLIVAETFASRLSVFDIERDGTLTRRRIWARLARATPEGICLDADGAVWVASPRTGEVMRVREGGAITDRMRVATQPYSCMLGGPKGRTLFIGTATTSDPEKSDAVRRGRIERVEVQTPHAGLP
jgi:sugar lactone lactonase YvrE